MFSAWCENPDYLPDLKNPDLVSKKAKIMAAEWIILLTRIQKCIFGK